MSSTETEAPRAEIFDSLPYYDNDLELHPNLKQKVEQELAREPKPPQTLHPRVPSPITLFAVRVQGFSLFERRESDFVE
jgi:pre-mRNA-splicing factor SPF27